MLALLGGSSMFPLDLLMSESVWRTQTTNMHLVARAGTRSIVQTINAVNQRLPFVLAPSFFGRCSREQCRQWANHGIYCRRILLAGRFDVLAPIHRWTRALGLQMLLCSGSSSIVYLAWSLPTSFSLLLCLHWCGCCSWYF